MTIDYKTSLIKVLGYEPSEEQWAAITAPLEPTLIVAGAGTGKTSVMTARVMWLIMTGQVDPERILGLTFTNKAADELKHRVREKLGVLGAALRDKSDAVEVGEPVITTYNAFGSRLLKEHALRIGLEPDARIVVDALRYQLAYRAVANTSLDVAGVGYNSRTATGDLVRFDEQMSNYYLEPQTIISGELQLIAKYENQTAASEELARMVEASRKRVLLAQLLIEYRQLKIEYAVIDYSDQVRLAADAAGESEAMRAALRDEFQVVLLDEYQDTSIAQKILLQRLFGDGHPVMAVGDPCQSIYRWRGAEITNMDSFIDEFTQRDGAPAVQLQLTINRRSVEKVLKAANELSADLRKLHPNIGLLKSTNEDVNAGSVRTGVHLKHSDEISWLCDQIEAHRKNREWRDIAVLTRTNSSIPAVVAELEKRGVPIQVADPDSLFELPEVREVISYLQVLCDPAENVALARILAGPRFAIGQRDLAIIGKFAQALSGFTEDESGYAISEQLDRIIASNDGSERVCLLDAIEQIDQIATKLSLEAVERVSVLSQELRELRKHIFEPVIDLVGRIIRVTGIGVEALVQKTENGLTHFDRLSMFLDLAGGFRDLDGQSTLQAFVAYISDNDRYNMNIDAELPSNVDAVTVMTIHKSKGLEFPVVILPHWTHRAFPSTKPDDYWFSNPEVVPHGYVPSRLNDPITDLPGVAENFKVDLDAHKALVREESRQDELRLAYVAVTRAGEHVVASSSWWGETQKTQRGPSAFLELLKKQSDVNDVWVEKPAEKNNPFLAGKDIVTWPATLDSAVVERIATAAELVRTAVPIEIAKLSRDEQETMALIDADISALQNQAAIAASDERVVRLPTSLTASQIMALAKDQTEFLKNLVRPMPRQPSRVADRGTAFHAWIEEFYGQRGLFDLDDLPGAMDSEIYSDDELERLKNAFKASEFATRAKPEMETPFGILFQGTTWRGRIDAVYAGTIADPSAKDRWVVIDWKTGRPGTADELQLHIYRHAWAGIKQIDIEQVEAAFYHVGDAQLVPLTETLSLDEIAARFLS
jgi:DNA helicase-2/ATP-dependent DNA helicase PcrA